MPRAHRSGLIRPVIHPTYQYTPSGRINPIVPWQEVEHVLRDEHVIRDERACAGLSWETRRGEAGRGGVALGDEGRAEASLGDEAARSQAKPWGI